MSFSGDFDLLSRWQRRLETVNDFVPGEAVLEENVRVLIVEEKQGLGELWKRHLERADCDVTLATAQDAATEILNTEKFAVIILDLVLEQGNALAIADYASFRQPDAQVVFVTNTSFFSDGTLFQHIPNLRAVVQRETPPADLTEMVRYYAESP